jgi:hypothetical protein
MNIIRWGKAQLKRLVQGAVQNVVQNMEIHSLVQAEVQNAVQEMLPLLPQLLAYQNSHEEDRQSYHDHTKDPFGNRDLFACLRDRLLKLGIPVEDVHIDVLDFERWLNEFPEVKDTYQGMGEVFVEKCLEHYLAFHHLRIGPHDTYIDMAAAGSPWADALNKKGIKSYRLDLVYPEGMHGTDIGADASNTSLPDGFATALSAQCAFECFANDADVGFVKEAARILSTGGRYGIVPLYVDDTYFVATSPYCNQEGITVEPEARKVWRDDQYKAPFSRHYSPESFQRRIFSNIPEEMAAKVLYFRNLPDIMTHYQGQRVYCFFMLYCERA